MGSIGTQRRTTRQLLQQFGLAPFRKILTSHDFAEAAESGGCAPRRKRVFIPEVVAWLMMYVGLCSCLMTQGLVHAWGLTRGVCPWLRGNSVTEEAFCLARTRVRLGFWRSLAQRYVNRFASSMRWKDRFRLLAIDGSKVDLPNVPALARFFGKPIGSQGEGKFPQGRLVALCSVFTGFCLSFRFTSLRFSEHTVLRHLIPKLQTDDLLLFDRGFFSLCGLPNDRSTKRLLPLPPLRSDGWIRSARSYTQ